MAIVCQAKGILKWVRFKAYPGGIYSCAAVVHNRLWSVAHSSHPCNAETHRQLRTSASWSLGIRIESVH